MIKQAKTNFEVIELIRERWSPRVFSSGHVSDEDLNRLFEAARWAASSSNEQPWRYLYARRNSKEYDMIMDSLSDFNQKWVGNAPIIIITAYKTHFPNGKENFHALHDLGLSMGNLSLQAQSMGIAVHHMAGVNWKKVHEIFGISDDYHVTTAVAVGYYGGDPDTLPEDLAESEKKERSRKPLNEIVSEGKWTFE